MWNKLPDNVVNPATVDEFYNKSVNQFKLQLILVYLTLF